MADAHPHRGGLATESLIPMRRSLRSLTPRSDVYAGPPMAQSWGLTKLTVFFFFLTIYLAVLGLTCVMWDLSLWHMDSLVVVHRLQGTWAQ